MRTLQHLFISANGDLLPRWRSAFALAEGVPMRVLSNLFRAEYAWLRLQQGVPVAQQIQAVQGHLPDALIIVLSDTPSDDEGMAAFSAAVRGYCNSHSSEEVLRQVATVVSQGGLWIGESLMAKLLVGVNRLPAFPSRSVIENITDAKNGAAPSDADSTKNGWHSWQDKQNSLTERELEVAQAVASGASNKEVARRLGITERTVKAHVGVIFTKLDVPDRLHLALRMRELHIPSA